MLLLEENISEWRVKVVGSHSCVRLGEQLRDKTPPEFTGTGSLSPTGGRLRPRLLTGRIYTKIKQLVRRRSAYILLILSGPS